MPTSTGPSTCSDSKDCVRIIHTSGSTALPRSQPASQPASQTDRQPDRQVDSKRVLRSTGPTACTTARVYQPNAGSARRQTAPHHAHRRSGSTAPPVRHTRGAPRGSPRGSAPAGPGCWDRSHSAPRCRNPGVSRRQPAQPSNAGRLDRRRSPPGSPSAPRQITPCFFFTRAVRGSVPCRWPGNAVPILYFIHMFESCFSKIIQRCLVPRPEHQLDSTNG